jgi:hypothetical protein
MKKSFYTSEIALETRHLLRSSMLKPVLFCYLISSSVIGSAAPRLRSHSTTELGSSNNQIVNNSQTSAKSVYRLVANTLPRLPELVGEYLESPRYENKQLRSDLVEFPRPTTAAALDSIIGILESEFPETLSKIHEIAKIRNFSLYQVLIELINPAILTNYSGIPGIKPKIPSKLEAIETNKKTVLRFIHAKILNILTPQIEANPWSINTLKYYDALAKIPEAEWIEIINWAKKKAAAVR